MGAELVVEGREEIEQLQVEVEVGHPGRRHHDRRPLAAGAIGDHHAVRGTGELDALLHAQRGRVTAPSAAEETSATYLAKTPLV